MSASRRLVAVTAALGLTAGGLVTATGTASVARGDGGDVVVDVFIDGTRTIGVAEQLRPGVHKFVVRSERQSGFQLLQSAAGYTKGEALRDVAEGLGAGKVRALKRFERNTTLVGGVYSAPEKPAVMWLDLEPGTYWAVDVNDMRPKPSEVVTIKVAGAATAAAMPDGPVIRAVDSTEFAKSPRSIPARGRLTFRNVSDQNHFVELARLAKGKTMADFEAWIEAVKSGNETPPPIDFRSSVGTGVIDPGREMAMTYSLRPGRYVMVCWWPDASMGGMPHAFMGMYRGIKVG